MTGLATPALWLLRRVTGLRLYHLLAATFAIAAALVGLALGFWWIGEQADSTVGPVGVVLVTAAYMATATVLLGFALVVSWRLLIARVRRTLGLAEL